MNPSILDRAKTGRHGEDLAVVYLLQHGYEILERNWKRLPYGEVDIVAREGDILVFVEVRIRGATSYESPQESVTPHKLHLLKTMAQIYAKSHSNLPVALRIDFIGVTPRQHEKPKIEHFKSIATG